MSQIVSFHSTSEDLTEESLTAQIEQHPAFVSGKLAAFEVKQVPKKFHAMFSATWRRYLYIFPLNTSSWIRNVTPKYDDESVPGTVYHFPVSRVNSGGAILERYEGVNGKGSDTSDMDGVEDVDIDVVFVNDMLQR